MYSYMYIYIIQAPCIVFITMPGFEPRTLYTVGKHCTTEIHSQLSKCTLVTYM